MSIQGVWGDGCRIVMSCPGVTGLGTGAYTAAILFKPNDFQATAVWKAYQPNNFSHRGLVMTSDGDMWTPDDPAETNIPSYSVPPTSWYWLIVSKGLSNEAARAHCAVYQEIGDMSWVHLDASGTQINQSAVDRIEFGDEFGAEFRGTVACFCISNEELTDAEIEDTFIRSSTLILSKGMGFFAHWPEVNGTSPTSDLAGSGTETFRTGSWTLALDPSGYDFSLGPPPRSGLPKIWNGASWNKHQIKSWNGSLWVPSKMNGGTAEGWVTSK